LGSGTRPVLLEVSSIDTGYWGNRVLTDASLSVSAGEIVAVIGHNGAGKSTLLKAVFGLLPVWRGTVRIQGQYSKPGDPRQMHALGVAFVPQGNRVFGTLSVRQNLAVSVAGIPGGDDTRRAAVSDAMSLFSKLCGLEDRRAGTLSGGEKQMLALAMGFAVKPRLMLLDEPSLGLSPRLVAGTMDRLSCLNKEHGVSILVVEQKVREVLLIADRVVVVSNGTVTHRGPAAELQDESVLRRVFL